MQRLRNSPERKPDLVITRAGQRNRQPTLMSICGAAKAVVFDPAANAIKAVFAQRFDPYHADSAKNWPHSISAVRMMHRDAQGTFPDLTWYKCGAGQAVEPVAAEIMSHGLHDFGRTGPAKAKRPVDLHPGSSAALPDYRIRFVNLECVRIVWETVDRFRQHKKAYQLRSSIFRANKQGIKKGPKSSPYQLLARILNVSLPSLNSPLKIQNIAEVPSVPGTTHGLTPYLDGLS